MLHFGTHQGKSFRFDWNALIMVFMEDESRCEESSKSRALAGGTAEPAPYQLTLIDLDDIQKNDTCLVEDCHTLWKQTYTPILHAAGEKIHSDGFFRSRVLMAVRREEKVVGFSLARFFDLRVPSTSEASYFDPVPKPLMRNLMRNLSACGDRICAVEWVTVRPELRAKFSKIQLVDLVMGVAIRFMLKTKSDAVMGFSRVDVGADRIAASFGIRPQGLVNLHGIDCQIMIGRREWVGAHRFAAVERAIADLWERRQDRYFAAENAAGSEAHEEAA